MKSFLTPLFILILAFSVSAQEIRGKGMKPAEDTLQYLRDIEQYSPNPEEHSVSSLYSIAEICSAHLDYNNALKYINLALAKDSGSAFSHQLKGETLYNMHQLEDAIPCYQAAIMLKPDLIYAYNGLGQCYYELKRYDLALRTFEASAEKCHPDFRGQKTYSMMGLIYTEQKDFDKALDAWYGAESKGVMGSEEYSHALYSIWLLETQKGNDAKADSAFRKLIRLTQPDPECPVADCYDYFACERIIRIYKQLKEDDKAVPYVIKLNERNRKL